MSNTFLNKSVGWINVTGSAPVASDLPLDQFRKVTIWTIVTLLVCFIGCLNNVVVLFVTWPRVGTKSSVNILIFHFILANFLNCLIHYPVRCVMVQARLSGYQPNLQACYFLQTFNTVNWLMVYMADAGLAINRCVALFFPHYYKVFSTTRKNLLQIIFMWTLCLAIVIPFDFEIGNKLVILPIGHCVFRVVPGVFYGVFFNIAKYTPFLIAGVASILILIKCFSNWRSGVTMRLNLRHAEIVRRRVRLALMLVVTFLWAVICNVTSGVIISAFPQIFERDPTANLWTQTVAVAQNAFTADLLGKGVVQWKDGAFEMSGAGDTVKHWVQELLEKKPKKSTFKVLLIGDSVGKSSLLLRFCADEFFEESSMQYIPMTLGLDVKSKCLEIEGPDGKEDVHLYIWDTAGQNRFRQMNEQYLPTVDAVILLYDVRNGATFVECRRFVEDVSKFCDTSITKILVGNKNDQDHSRKCVSSGQGQSLAKQIGYEFIETSAKDNINVDELFRLVAQLCLNKACNDDMSVSR